MSTFLLSYFSTFYLLWDEIPLLKFWYSCAVLLIVSSIVMVAYQVVHIDDVAGGLLYYVAQSFLLAGSTSPGTPSPSPDACFDRFIPSLFLSSRKVKFFLFLENF